VDHRLEVAAIDRPRSLALGDEVVQGLLADGGEDHVAHGAVRVSHAGGGQLEQQRGLAGDALEVGDQLALHPLLGPAADATHGGDEQVGEAVGDLAPAHLAEGGEQHEADRVRMPAQLVQLLDADPAAVGEQHARGHAVEQVVGQRQRADAPEPIGFFVHALEAGLAGAGTQHEQRGWVAATLAVVLCAAGNR